MNLDEVIRINTVLKQAPVLKDDPKVVAALNLNIEALKRELVWRQNDPGGGVHLLPGETED